MEFLTEAVLEFDDLEKSYFDTIFFNSPEYFENIIENKDEKDLEIKDSEILETKDLTTLEPEPSNSTNLETLPNSDSKKRKFYKIEAKVLDSSKCWKQ